MQDEDTSAKFEEAVPSLESSEASSPDLPKEEGKETEVGREDEEEAKVMEVPVDLELASAEMMEGPLEEAEAVKIESGGVLPVPGMEQAELMGEGASLPMAAETVITEVMKEEDLPVASEEEGEPEEVPLPVVNPDDFLVLDDTVEAAAKGPTSTGVFRTMGPTFGFISPDDDDEPLFTHLKHVKFDCDLAKEADPFVEWMKGREVEFKRVVLECADAKRECAVLVTGLNGHPLRFPLTDPGRWRFSTQRKHEPKPRTIPTQREIEEAEQGPWFTGVISKFSGQESCGWIVSDKKEEQVYVHLFHMVFDVNMLREGCPYVSWLVGKTVRFKKAPCAAAKYCYVAIQVTDPLGNPLVFPKSNAVLCPLVKKKRANKIPLDAPGAIVCEICAIAIHVTSIESHLGGRKHKNNFKDKKKLNLITYPAVNARTLSLSTPLPSPISIPRLKRKLEAEVRDCEICKIPFQSVSMRNAHLGSKKHQKQAAVWDVIKKYIPVALGGEAGGKGDSLDPSNFQETDSVQTMAVGANPEIPPLEPDPQARTLKSVVVIDDDLASSNPISKKSRPKSGPTTINCHVCKIVLSSQKAFEIHTAGKRHMRNAGEAKTQQRINDKKILPPILPPIPSNQQNKVSSSYHSLGYVEPRPQSSRDSQAQGSRGYPSQRTLPYRPLERSQSREVPSASRIDYSRAPHHRERDYYLPSSTPERYNVPQRYDLPYFERGPPELPPALPRAPAYLSEFSQARYRALAKTNSRAPELLRYSYNPYGRPAR